MKMVMLLPLSALVLLISPASAKPHGWHSNFTTIITLAEKYNKSLSTEQNVFVEDVQSLLESGCGDAFFCKVHDILHNHTESTKNMQEYKDKIVRNLRVYNSQKKVNCEELRKGVTPAQVTSPLSDLLENLTRCCKQRNFIGAGQGKP